MGVANNVVGETVFGNERRTDNHRRRTANRRKHQQQRTQQRYVFEKMPAGHPLRTDFRLDAILAPVLMAKVIPELYVGAAFSGAQVHRHNSAVNALIFGVKRWYLFPPTHKNWGPRAFGLPVRDWVEGVLPKLKARWASL